MNACVVFRSVALSSLVLCGCSKPATPPATVAPANRALYEYLGDPVAAPQNLEEPYTSKGLAHAIQEAAQTAGVSLAKVMIDDSEFPFLVGVTTVNRGDFDELKNQLRQMPEYNFGGGVGNDTTFAMNLVPAGQFPPGTHERIYHRMSVREAILFDKVSGK